MERRDSILDHFKQNKKLPIRIVSPDFGHLSADEALVYGKVYRTPYYFFLFMLDGNTQHTVDMQHFEVGNNELLFIMPHQVHEQPLSKHGIEYFK